MTNVTLSIDDEVYRKMKKFSEIRWSDFVRKVIEKRIEDMEQIEPQIFADERLLAENWLSKEDKEAWKNL